MVFAIVGGVLLVVVAVVCLFLNRIIFYSPLPGQNDHFNLPEGEQLDPYREGVLKEIAELEKVPFEPVEIRAYDKIRLFGRFYKGREDAPFMILFHGFRGTSIRDFGSTARWLIGKGLNVLMIDERATGQSGSHSITYGIKERMDCLSWTDYLEDRFGKEISVCWFGISLGAATVLMASGLDTPQCLKGIIADAPYSSPSEIICEVGRAGGFPVKLLYPFAVLTAAVFGHFNLRKTSAVEAVKQAKVPILLIHGDDDRFVPCRMGIEIAEANPAIRLELFPGAGHALCALTDTERYRALVEAFLKDVAGTSQW